MTADCHGEGSQFSKHYRQNEDQEGPSSGIESRIANRTMSRVAGRNRQTFRSEKHKHEWNRSRVELWKIDSESLIHIATYQYLAETLESHDLNRPTLNRTLLDSESAIQCR